MHVCSYGRGPNPQPFRQKFGQPAACRRPNSESALAHASANSIGPREIFWLQDPKAVGGGRPSAVLMLASSPTRGSHCAGLLFFLEAADTKRAKEDAGEGGRGRRRAGLRPWQGPLRGARSHAERAPGQGLQEKNKSALVAQSSGRRSAAQKQNCSGLAQLDLSCAWMVSEGAERQAL